MKPLHKGVTQAKEPEAVNTYLQKPKNVYQFRRRIPGELQQILGRKEIVESLRTRDYEEAKRLGNIRAVETDAEFAAAGAQLAAATRAVAPHAQPIEVHSPVNADEVASRTLGLLRQRRDAAAAQGYDALTAFHERMRRGLDDQEAILLGDLEPSTHCPNTRATETLCAPS